METASTPTEMPPPQTKDVIKNGKGKYPIKLIMLISLSLVFLHFRLSIPSCSFVSWIYQILLNVMSSLSFSMIFAYEHITLIHYVRYVFVILFYMLQSKTKTCFNYMHT